MLHYTMQWDKKETLIALVASLLIVANVSASKVTTVYIPVIGELSLSVAVFPIAVTFFLTDVINEKYGQQAARRAVVSIVLALFVAYSALQLITFLPHTGGISQDAYETTLFASTPIFVSSLITISITQPLDIILYNKVRKVTSKQHRYLRNIVSTPTTQLVDTALFSVLGFIILPSVLPGGVTLPYSVVLTIILTEWMIKCIIALLDTPVFQILTRDEGAKDVA